MSHSRFAILLVLTLTALIPGAETRAQGKTSTSTVMSDGSMVTTGQNGTIQTITAQGAVYTISDGAAQIITPDGEIITTTYAKGQTPPPGTLDKALGKTFWEPNQRGPLIAVGAEKVHPVWQREFPKPQIGPDGNYVDTTAPAPPLLTDGRYRVTEIADFFGQRIVRLNGLSAVAPKERVVLNTTPGKPDYFADLPRPERTRLLKASLTAAQWKLLGSETGLGASDLSGRQRELFLSCLPDPMVIRKYQAGENGYRLIKKEKPIVVSANQRSAVRLRLNRVAQYSLPLEGGFHYTLYREGFRTPYAIHNSGLFEEQNRDSLFGKKIRNTVPNRLKAQQIDFAAPALQAAISLTELKTVGDLVARIRIAAHVAIFVDGRMAKQTLWVRAEEGQTVSAGEALRALCWSLSGAVRAVSDTSANTIFILTEDADGFGSRMARLQDWVQAAQQRSSELQTELKATKLNPLQYIGFASSDADALSAKGNKAVEDSWQSPKERMQGVIVPLSEIGLQQQRLLRYHLKEYQKGGSNYRKGEQRSVVDNGTVFVSVQIHPFLIVPGVGAVRDNSLDFGGDTVGNLLPAAANTEPDPNTANAPPEIADTIPIPRNMPAGGVLCVSPTTPEEVVNSVRAARTKGLKQIWIVLPISIASAENDALAMKNTKALLAAATAEAQKEKPEREIIAGVRLFSLPADQTRSGSQGLVDLSITGERLTEAAQHRADAYKAARWETPLPRFLRQKPRDWVPPDAPGLTMRLTRNLAEIAALPGLSGLALLDTAPPGYCLPSVIPSFLPPDSKMTVGYTPATRIAFLRTAGFDPIDIASPFSAGMLNLQFPHFQDENQNRFIYSSESPNARNISSADLWNRFRFEIISHVLTDLYKPLMEAVPKRDGGFPVYLQSLDTATRGSDSFSRWERNEPLPRGDAAGSFLDIPYFDYPSLSESTVSFAHSVHSRLSKTKGGRRGLVLNFSDISVDRALKTINETVFTEKVLLTGRQP